MEKLTADPHTGKITWTRNAFHTMAEIGLFDESYYELLDGEIFQVLINETHSIVLAELALALPQTFDEELICLHSSLVVGPFSEIRPDVGVLKSTEDPNCNTNAPPGNAFSLVVEIADTTLKRDRGQKAKLYAEAGVPEYWIVNITGRTLIVYRDPVDGEYRNVQTFDDTQSIAPEAAADHPISVSEILPPKE